MTVCLLGLSHPNQHQGLPPYPCSKLESCQKQIDVTVGIMADMNMSSVASHAGFVVKYLLSNWSLDLPVSIPFIFIPLYLYLRGLRAIDQSDPRIEGGVPGSSNGEILVFATGMSILAISILSPIMYWSMVYLWMHILFHILVMLAAPPLIAYSKPWRIMEAGVPERFRPLLQGLLTLAKGDGLYSRFIRILTSPALALTYFVATMVAWFIPQMMTWAVDNKYAMLVMHLTFITSGMLFFTQLIDSDPYRSRVAHPVKRMGMIAVAAITSWLLAMFMGFAPHPWYPVYWQIQGKTMSPMADQQVAASLLWVLCMEPLIYSAYYNIKLWITMSEENTLSEIRRPWLRQS